MNEYTIAGPAVYTESGILPGAHVVVQRGTIKAIRQSRGDAQTTISFPSHYHLVPGFIDLHVHGANNYDVMDGPLTTLAPISHALAAEGTTAFLATTMTAATADIEKVLMATRDFLQAPGEKNGATVLGVHLEGPFISPHKVGAQRADQVRLPDMQLIEHWQNCSAGAIKLITLAPELAQSLELIQYLTAHNIVAAIGHTNATYAQTVQAIAAGCTYVAHLFNAMSGIHQREPGAVTAALLSDQVMTELIVDGVHLHPAIVQLVVNLKKHEKIILVTDAMRAKCLGDGTYDLGGQPVTVTAGVAKLANGTLAGSVLSMAQAIKNMLAFTDCSLADAIKMATENPARALGIFAKKGSIAVNKDADLVVLNEQLEVVLTIVAGKVVYQQSVCDVDESRQPAQT